MKKYYLQSCKNNNPYENVDLDVDKQKCCIQSCSYETAIEVLKMPHPLLIVSQSDSLIQIVDINSHTERKTVQI